MNIKDDSPQEGVFPEKFMPKVNTEMERILGMRKQQQFKELLDAYDHGDADKTDVARALTEMCGTAGKELTDRACKILSRSR